MAPKDKDNDKYSLDDIPHERKEPRPDFTKPLPRQSLPKELVASLEKNEQEAWSAMYDGTAPDSTESNVRYAAYASRLRTIMLSAHRYVAYTSDIGESFRPVAHPYWVRGAYAVSWMYLIGDVGNEGRKAWLRNQEVLHPEKFVGQNHGEGGGVVGAIKGAAQNLQESVASVTGQTPASPMPGHVAAIDDYRTVMVQRAVFQGIASMGLPAFTIHSLVKYSGMAMKNVKNTRIRTWGPIGVSSTLLSHRNALTTSRLA